MCSSLCLLVDHTEVEGMYLNLCNTSSNPYGKQDNPNSRPKGKVHHCLLQFLILCLSYWKFQFACSAQVRPLCSYLGAILDFD